MMSSRVLCFLLAACLCLSGVRALCADGAVPVAADAAAEVSALSVSERQLAEERELQERLEKIRREEVPQVPAFGSREALIAQTSLLVLSRFHVLHPQLGAALSVRWYRSYFELLDPAKIYFLQGDLEEFREVRARLWDEHGNVNIRFAFMVYQRFLERLRQWVLYSVEVLDQPQDFTVDESIPFNMKTEELDWCNSEEEQRQLWRRRIKDVLLSDALQKEKQQSKQEGSEAKPSKPPVVRDVRFRNKKSLVASWQYRSSASAGDILGYFLNGLACLLDPHTSYMTPAVQKDFDIHMSNSLQGAGFVLSLRDFYVTIVEIIPGGPAARDGQLKPGDRILAVAQGEDEEPVEVNDMKLDDVVSMIRGPKGTPVLLTIQPKGASTTYVLRLIRDEVVLKEAAPQSTIHEVTGKEGKPLRILQLYIPSFYCDMEAREAKKADFRSTTNDARRLLQEAMASGPVDGVILDLRGNGGGYMDEACGLSGLFFKGGPVVQAKVDNDVEVLRDPTPDSAVYDGPLVVLVDKLSASASEITAACLQDCGRALICGDPVTHGKGSMQMPMDLMRVNFLAANASLLGKNSDGSTRSPGALKITNGRFYRINGVSTQDIGVTPDITFPSFIQYMGTGESTLPHVLPSDTIRPVKYTRDMRISRILPELKAQMAAYCADSAAFQRYAAEVQRYRQLMELRELPLQIDARRKFQAETEHCLKQLRHYQPDRGSDGEKPVERLSDDDDEGDDAHDEDGGPSEDVILEATLEAMKGLCSLLSSAS